jgi:hypothetical protein
VKTNTKFRKDKGSKAPKGMVFTTPAGNVLFFPDEKDKPTFIVGKDGQARLHGSVKRTVLSLCFALQAEKGRRGQVKFGNN